MIDCVGPLRDVSALELGAMAARAAMAKCGVPLDWIDHVVFGNVLQTSADAAPYRVSGGSSHPVLS